MTKKFTEEKYQKIADCFDKANEKYNMGVMNPNLLIQVQDELFGEFDFINDWKEIFAIANPITRDEAHEKFVEKEKKYYWKTKKTDEDGDHLFLIRTISGSIRLRFNNEKNKYYKLTKTEIREWGYNPDMFDREEVE